MFGRRNEIPEVRIMRQAMRQAGRKMAVHNALAPIQPNKIDPSTGRTNRDMKQIKAARKSK